MESEEAIMENENNSNLESESNIRERDLLLLRDGSTILTSDSASLNTPNEELDDSFDEHQQNVAEEGFLTRCENTSSDNPPLEVTNMPPLDQSLLGNENIQEKYSSTDQIGEGSEVVKADLLVLENEYGSKSISTEAAASLISQPKGLSPISISEEHLLETDNLNSDSTVSFIDTLQTSETVSQYIKIDEATASDLHGHISSSSGKEILTRHGSILNSNQGLNNNSHQQPKNVQIEGKNIQDSHAGENDFLPVEGEQREVNQRDNFESGNVSDEAMLCEDYIPNCNKKIEGTFFCNAESVLHQDLNEVSEDANDKQNISEKTANSDVSARAVGYREKQERLTGTHLQLAMDDSAVTVKESVGHVEMSKSSIEISLEHSESEVNIPGFEETEMLDKTKENIEIIDDKAVKNLVMTQTSEIPDSTKEILIQDKDESVVTYRTDGQGPTELTDVSDLVRESITETSAIWNIDISKSHLIDEITGNGSSLQVENKSHGLSDLECNNKASEVQDEIAKEKGLASSTDPKNTDPIIPGLNVKSTIEANEEECSMNKDVNSQVSSKTKDQDSDDDLMEITEIKKEEGSSDELAVSKDSIKAENLKHEPDINRDDDDVVVLDDEGEVFPFKKESMDSKTVENGLGIQISEVSGQQHQLHASAESNEVGANSKVDSTKPKQSKSKIQACIVCQKMCRCKYNIVRNGDIKHLCDDVCFKQFRKSPSSFLKNKEATVSKKESTKNPTFPVPPLDSASKAPSYKTCSVCQLMNVNTQSTFCNWKGLDFCGETCLGKFQANLNTSCSFCHAYIPLDMRATFCLKIGNDMRPFCKPRCVTEFKKKLRLCAFCQRDIAAMPGSFKAMIGSHGQMKEFCTQGCFKKMEEQVNAIEFLSIQNNASLESCTVCEKQYITKYSFKHRGDVHRLCSDLCLSAFQYMNKIDLNKCDRCKKLCMAEEVQAHFVQFEGTMKRFCSDECVNDFRRINSKVVPCSWCTTKKLNFDMIERLDSDNKFQMFCSLTCLSLYRVNLQAKSNQAITCDQCRKVVPAQYHLTMSDASVRNFCSYVCVMTFQSQFAAKHNSSSFVQQSPVMTGAQQQIAQPLQKATPGPKSGRSRARQGTTLQESSFPVISNVVSLAPLGGEKQQPVNIQSPASYSLLMSAPGPSNTANNMVPSGDGKHQILIQTPTPKTAKNKSLQCRPFTQTKATSCRPHSQTKDTQTDEVQPKQVLIPIPVPIYIPMPTLMYAAPTPKIVPFPVPIPVPIFIPTTRKSANGISKAIREIVERMPADPLEAELLMMAEAVAADKRPGDSDTDSEGDNAVDDFGTTEDEEVRPSQKEDVSMMVRKREGQGEEDMIQMALRMAEEMSGPIEDLESSVEPVAVNSDPPGQHSQQTVTTYEDQIDEDYIPSRSSRGRGVKRQGRGRPPLSRPKRQRTDRNSYTEDDSMSSQSQQSHSMEPPPDSNYKLKFTYGVNAWRHWVINKNAQIEKTKQSTGSYRMRTFPTDILKCTTDELNFTLCMFLKEVRKPNGEVYSPDSIYYLCLGIQQYLYENGRIDNIFTDMYFDKFTDSLHETLKTLQPKLKVIFFFSFSGQMLCRIEEEHLWESKQLGAHSPFVLLNTLIYFHTKHFILKTAQEHMSLSFAQILKHWKKGVPLKGQPPASGKNVSLRFYCLANGKKDGLAARKNKEGVPVYEVTENFENPLRCPVKLYEFFLSKCPESIKNRNDIFYPVPERSCVPDSPVWYSTQSIDIHTMDKMLTRVLLVREIQEAHLHAQPIYL
ncbi:unnamed protein product [Lymnaea stagnalis]|uniref:TRASH domain-containing protein n=1 Tax=Lymnaea stagnalis TaxID=6523 RepID=A0AAV2ID25_LYMST